MIIQLHRIVLLTILSTGFVNVAIAEPTTEIDFNRDIRPILSDKCFYCHGPDPETQEAGLRLDSRDEAIEAIDSGELIDRITSDDPDVLMPPPESNLSLTDADRQTLREWIDQGAKYQGHWAFENLPETVAVPEVSDPKWPRQTIDKFVLARIDESQSETTHEADPLRWLRRVSLDLTGLPPSPELIKRFRSMLAIDGKEPTYLAIVDQLLASTAFGEHMAVAWLDAARYADSYGYQSDKLNTQWPYRDWVVRALNQNLPYDDFLTWQLAGDLLNNPTRDQLVATAFNRVHRLNNEGGAVFEEWRLENVADRVHTFGTAVLGLTMECCRCHDHKYDPIPAEDYYSLSAFFNSIDESGVYDRTQKVPCPSILLPTDEQASALDLAKSKLADTTNSYQIAVGQAKKRWKTKQRNNTATAPSDFIVPDLELALGFDRPFDNSLKQFYHPSQSDRSWTSMVDLVDVNDCAIEPIDNSTAADRREESDESNQKRLALKLDGERGITTEGIEPFDRWTPFSVAVTLRETKRVAQRSLIAHHTRGTDCGYNGWDLTIVDGHLESRLYRVWPGNAIGIRTVDPIAADQWHQISATYDGSSQADGLKLFLGGERLEATTLRDQLKKSCNVVVDHGGQFVVGQRFRARGLDGGLIDDVRVYSRDLTVDELKFLATGQTPDQPSADYYVSAIDDKCRTEMASLNAARKAVVMAEEAMTELPVMQETESPRPAHLLARGEYDAPKNDETQVQRKTLSCIDLEVQADESDQDRLTLARWVTDPSHPLTARVTVNRLWSNFFASPLVRTPENFGSQGELPTHPELLDWLSRDFISHGWDVKRLCKQIVMSATYRQDSLASPQSLENDPTNRMLARGPAYRLTAEQIRDVALSASGLMNSKIGGPPVSPYQPGIDLWKESNGMSPPYQQSVGKSLYRRSLYSVWKRTAPLPNMMAFDSTTRETCTVKRSRTNTPLQALVLLNDIQFIESARVLAEDIVAAKDQSKWIDDAFLRLAGRSPDSKEQKVLQKLLNEELDFYTKNVKAAKQLISMGETAHDESADLPELAAMTNVCQAILNLDATIWKR